MTAGERDVIRLLLGVTRPEREPKPVARVMPVLKSGVGFIKLAQLGRARFGYWLCSLAFRT